MKMVHKTETFAVFDDFLSAEDFRLSWNYMQAEHFDFIQVKRWVKTNRLLDGNGLVGPIVYSHGGDGRDPDKVMPTNTGIEPAVVQVAATLEELHPWAGRNGEDWEYFTARPFLYPQGTGLSWHDDYSKTTAQFVLYVHPYWNSQWGAELMISDVRNMPRPRLRIHGTDEPKFAGPFVDNADESQALMEHGIGHYVTPKPNRLIIMASGVQHMVKKVEPAAGDHLRASITGFIVAPNKPERRIFHDVD